MTKFDIKVASPISFNEFPNISTFLLSTLEYNYTLYVSTVILIINKYAYVSHDMSFAQSFKGVLY